jgi:hypothetical protein
MFARLGCALLLVAATASAQEYGRTSGGELQMFTKQPSKLAATLGFNFGSGKGFEGSVGGTLIEDRMWFFASAIRDEKRSVAAALPQTAEVKAVDAKLITQLGASQMISGSYSSSTVTSPLLLTAPESFLNLRYTGIISPNAFFTASVSKAR